MAREQVNARGKDFVGPRCSREERSGLLCRVGPGGLQSTRLRGLAGHKEGS